ncbi:Squalene synthase [hydrothermal vent metagenome]|uniref:Squalene synthase n=1 Tax=hydrothermal vent metagenome TaxID=652676 RepID=A0A3B1AS09_9ZZZZ
MPPDAALAKQTPLLRNHEEMPKVFKSTDELQNYLLLGVSRTFALTIPQLPAELCRVVSNGYLLCRIVDTIEDDPALDATQKRHYSRLFTAAVAGEADAGSFAQSLSALLSTATIPAEHELVQLTPEVIKITHSFDDQQREALATCVRVMAEGMVYYQELDTHAGLTSLANMEKYCYYVAGVVGEMLTRLFCAYSPEIARNCQEMQRLSIAFGQGLQMTNILKDIWDDHQRGACWLPQEIFSRHDFDLADMAPEQNDAGFEKGIDELIAIGHDCLKQALEYTLLIPAREAGIRSFCFLAIGMAELTLRKINDSKRDSHGTPIKISRRSVKGLVTASRVAVRNDSLLRTLFKFCGRGLP